MHLPWGTEKGGEEFTERGSGKRQPLGLEKKRKVGRGSKKRAIEKLGREFIQIRGTRTKKVKGRVPVTKCIGPRIGSHWKGDPNGTDDGISRKKENGRWA